MRGNLEARRIADEAIGVFVESFGPFAQDRLALAYGPTWREDRRFSSSAIGLTRRSLTDPSDLLGLLVDSPEFQKAFAAVALVAPLALGSLGRAVRDRRNLLYHRTRPWEASDAWLLVDGLGQILAAFDLMRDREADALRRLAAEAAAVVAGDSEIEMESARRAYLESVIAGTRYVDLGGISAKVGSRVVKIDLDEVFVEPGLEREGASSDATLDPFDVLLLRHTVIIGGPGAGKSTLARHLARLLALRPDERVPQSTPILVVASRIAEALEIEPGLTLRRYICERLTDRFGSLFAADLNGGRSTVLVDGLDEVVDERARTRVGRVIGEFAADFGDVSLIVTTRPVGFRLPATWSDFVQLSVAGLDDERVRRLVTAWAGVLAANDDSLDPEVLLDDIYASRGVRDLASTPLLLTILVLLWRRGTRLPTQRVEVYEAATQTLLGDWPSRRLGKRFGDPRRLLRLLQPVAHDMLASGAATVSEATLLARWQHALREIEAGGSEAEAATAARDLLITVQEHTGFFVEAGYLAGERQYAFLHRSFAEYLAALSLAEAWDARTLVLDEYVTSKRWREVVRLFGAHLGMRGPSAASALAEALLELDLPAERYLRRGLRLVLSMLADGLEIRPDTRDAVIATAVDACVDPRTEAFRIPLKGQLVAVRAAQPLGRSLDRLLVGASDHPQLAARKAWLRSILLPPTPERLAEYLAHERTLIASAWDEAETAISIGLAFTDNAMIGLNFSLEELPTGVVLSAGELFAPEQESVDLLLRAGIPSYAAAELAEQPRLIADPFALWMLDLSTLEELTPEQLVRLIDSDSVRWIAGAMAQPWMTGWHEAHRDEIAALGLRADLPPRTVDLAIEFAEELGAPLDIGAWWLGVAEGMKVHGSFATRHYAWARLGSEPSLGLERLVAVLDNPAEDPVALEIRRAAAIVAVDLTGRGESVPEDLVSALEVIALDDSDPVARGLARRALVVGELTDHPMALLASPEVAVDGEQALGTLGLDHTHVLVHFLLTLPDALDDRRAMASVLEAVLRVAPLDANEIPLDEGIANPEAERIARRLADAPRAETRGWAAIVLGALNRGESTTELGLLLGDSDARVCGAAAHALHAEDLRTIDWLLEVLPEVLRVADEDVVGALAIAVREHAGAAAAADVHALAEALMDAGDVPGALWFLSNLDAAE